MNRFRKKSDARRSQVPPIVDNRPTQLQPPPSLPLSSVAPSEPEVPQESVGLPELPPINDFRTSLILPDLSRRFTLLRTSAGDHVSLDGLKDRFAEKRALGGLNIVSEEEENIIMETLGKLQSTPHSASASTDLSDWQSHASMASSSRSTKRYSGNLFGSTRFRDQSYIRAASKHSSQAHSTAPSEGSGSQYIDNARPITPTGSYSTFSSPEKVRVQPVHEYASPPSKRNDIADFRHRASVVLEDIFKEMESEAEEKIVLPRTARRVGAANGNATTSVEAGMAISADVTIADTPDDQRASPVPTRTLPGYVPGMQRPRTPLDSEIDDIRASSITPRGAIVPRHDVSPSKSSFSTSSPISSLFQDGSVFRQPRPLSPGSSPLYLHRKPTMRVGGSTPDDESEIGAYRRRPASPLSTSATYQSLVSAALPSSTPEQDQNPIYGQDQPKSSFTHSHNDSWTSETGATSADMHSTSTKSPTVRSLKSPPLPDSPMFDHGFAYPIPLSGPEVHGLDSTDSNADRSMSPMSLVDLGAPVIPNRSILSPTPRPSHAPSPAFDSSSNSSSKNSTPFSLAPYRALVLSAGGSSSRSSLVSMGSSYHSWEGDERDPLFTLVHDLDPNEPVWHDLSVFTSSKTTPEGSPMDDGPETIVAQYAGLRKSDFVAMQEKLVKVSQKKASTELKGRTPSLRRRRPSTSQSNYSLNLLHSSSPSQPASPPPVMMTAEAEQNAKASALLNSVVDSIQANPRKDPFVLDFSAANYDDKKPDSLMQLNHDLARALFGGTDSRTGLAEQVPSSPSTPVQRAPQAFDFSAGLDVESPPPTATSDVMPTAAATDPSPAVSPYLLKNPSTPRIPRTPEEEAELAREIRRKTDAAMVALKRIPSKSKSHGISTGSISRKRISPHQISTPHLVSASTTDLDTIPLRSPSMPSDSHAPGTSKLSSRFKRFRGTLRHKAAPSGEHASIVPSDPSAGSMPASPMITVHGPLPTASTADLDRYKTSVTSPPATSGPSLKSFMARFRGSKQRAAESMISHIDKIGAPFQDFSQSVTPQNSEPSMVHTFTSEEPLNSPTPKPRPPRPQPPNIGAQPHTHTMSAFDPSDGNFEEGDSSRESQQAIRQLFDAASKIGLDESALNELLRRSGSTSSRATNKTSSSTVVDSKRTTYVHAPPVSYPPRVDESAYEDTGLNLHPENKRRPVGDRHGNPADFDSLVVRRTLIFPSNTKVTLTSGDVSSLMPRNSTNINRRRTSTLSTSSRSLQDRIPTPPPAKTSVSRRFSTEPSPPVPQMPSSLSTSASPPNLLVPHPVLHSQTEKSPVSTHSQPDSFYESYSRDVRSSVPLSDRTPARQPSEDDASRAVEVIELANGQTIWKIVDSLRDVDSESMYRASFASDYSTVNDSMQVYFKDRGARFSTTSNGSFLGPKMASSSARPETKVFYSSAAHIGRLIEDISQGTEAGSFNILPSTVVGHHSHSSSASSSMDPQWTVEERLEHMLGTLRAG
ncbi:hypothetical protein FISHEDRAFT_71306 [Fistulina hepatica ATCC 64428]|nr:hypothetical protein FISHEDRAFT_71306 [Fistulina hepatica ATCC 64428]